MSTVGLAFCRGFLLRRGNIELVRVGPEWGRSHFDSKIQSPTAIFLPS